MVSQGEQACADQQQAATAAVHERLSPLRDLPGPVQWSFRPVERALIWDFCQAVQDANPIYWDDEFAARSAFGRLVAPAQSLASLVIAPPWLPPVVVAASAERAKTSGPSPFRAAMAALQELGYPTATNVGREEEYLEAIGPGDGRIGQIEELRDISAVKRTRVGFGVFITTVISFVTERAPDIVVARATNTLLMYAPHEGVAS